MQIAVATLAVESNQLKKIELHSGGVIIVALSNNMLLSAFFIGIVRYVPHFFWVYVLILQFYRRRSFIAHPQLSDIDVDYSYGDYYYQ